MTRDTQPKLDRPSDEGAGIEIERGQAVVVAGQVAYDDPADRWLVLLRWVAIGGMGATIVVATSLVPGLNVAGLFAVLLVIAASNLFWMGALTLKARNRAALLDRPEGRRWVEVQLVADVTLLTAMLWFAGGITNPFVAFLTFQIALCGLLSSPRATIGIACLTIVAVGLLCLAPPLPPLTSWEETMATVVSITSIAALLGAFVAVYAQRLDRLRQESGRNEKLAVLGRLVGAMSHELNTPLATILLSSRDLERYGEQMPPAEAKQLVSTIAAEAERANEIIGLVRGHVGPDQIVEVVELASFVEKIAAEELDRLGFSGERRFELEGPLRVPVMKRALVQLLVNVLRNATEASLLSRRRRITITVKQLAGQAEVSVEDKGPGFTPEILARLGEPFQTTKEKQGGMGLGLYVSGMLAKQMDSVLRVQSAPGGGARVSLSIDLASPTRVPKRAPRVDDGDARDVDDA